MLLLICSITLLAAAVGCGGDAGSEDGTDIGAESLAFDDTTGADSQTSDTPMDAEAPDTVGDDAGAEAEVGVDEVSPEVDDNQQPGFDALPSVTVKMGHQEQFDITPFIDDAEDDDADLVLSWSAAHVGLADNPEHLLLVVGPVDWFGEEIIELTVTDSGGKSASAMLKVVVEEVKPPDPITPPPECPKTLFSYAGSPDANEVLVAGTFNDWSAGGDKALALSDPDGDKTWTLELDLEPGTWLYKFVVDGAWLSDPANPETADDGYGGVNSVIIVPSCDEGGE